jgi:hypothetical protein
VTERWGYEWIVSREADERIGDRLRRIAEENMREAARVNGGVTLGEIWHVDRVEFVMVDQPVGDDISGPATVSIPVDRARMLGLDVTALPHFYLDRYEADVTDRA